MAAVAQLTNGTVTVDLFGGTLQLLMGSWTTTTSEEKVWETFDVSASAADSTIRETKIKVDVFAQQALDYAANPNEDTKVVFQWYSDGEGTKQALVYQIESEILGTAVVGPLLGKKISILRIAILRHQTYENVSEDVTDTEAALSTLGGIWDIRDEIASAQMGSSPGRIKSLIIDNALPAPTALQQVWCGIRPLYKGTTAFVALWEAEDGSIGNSTANHATASGGTYAVCDLTNTANDGLRGSIYLEHVAADNFDDFVGKYLVLARMRVDSANTEVNVEIRQYWQGSHSHAGSTYVDGQTNWYLFPLGEISIPPTGNRDSVASANADFDQCGFSIFANGADDTGALHIDCFVLIPSEYMVVVAGATINATGTNPDYLLTLYTDPDDHQWALGVSSLSQGGLQPTFQNWVYPIEGGIMVFAGQADSGHTLSTTADLAITVTPRWKSYRSAPPEE